MNRTILLSAVVSCMLLPSCRLLNQRVDFSWFRDTMSAPQSDSVYVESGQGLPASAAPVAAQPAQTAPVANEPVPAAAAPVAEPVAAAPAPVAPVAAPAKQATVAGRTHTVAKGDTLGAIARRYNSTVPAICAANGLTNPDALKLGTVLTIPSGAGHAATTAHAHTPATSKKATAHTPASKRSFWKFWKKDPATPQHHAYTVRQGDTLNAIARRHGVTPASLMQANGLGRSQANKLSIGQKLIIPSTRK